MGMELACVPNEVNGNPITYRYRTIAGAEAINTVQPSGIKGWLTLNMSYHFRELSPRGTWVPFVTGGVGVTAFALNEPEQSHHYGGGIGIWRSRHRAWRVEYSKHVIADARFRSVRVGLMLR
jgi:hypothetical protein